MSYTGINLLSGLIENKDESSPGVVVIKLSGEPYANALVQCVAANYNRITGREVPTDEELYDRIGQKVTLIRGGTNMLGGGVLNAMEGKLFAGNKSTFGILPKGARKNGYVVKDVVDVLDGYATDQARELVESVRAHYPTLQNLTQERLEDLPRSSDTCSLAILGSHPVWGGVDCIWLIGEYWPDEDICDTNVLLIRPEYATSEYGSCLGRELLNNRALGEIVGFEPISFKEAIDLCDEDFDVAAKFIFDRAAVAA